MKLPIHRDENYNKVAYRTMKYAILYGALFNKFSNFETIRVLGNRLLKAVDSLVFLFGKPSLKTLITELDPLSERYDYIFRRSQIENFFKQLDK